MPYNLYLTANGRTAKTLRSPYPTRAETMGTVRKVLLMRHLASAVDAKEFAREVAYAPLGEIVTHTATGVSFRTEEVPDE